MTELLLRPEYSDRNNEVAASTGGLKAEFHESPDRFLLIFHSGSDNSSKIK